MIAPTNDVMTGQVDLSVDDTGPAEPPADRRAWGAVGSLSLCVSLLIAAEFLPVSLLTPIAADLRATEGLAGQAISVSGLFAVLASLLIASVASRFDRRHVLLGLSAVMLTSLLVIARAGSFAMLMVARSLLGVAIGGFWALATATVMRLVPARDVPKALGLVYTGNAIATAVAAPIGSYLGGIIGWRGVFLALMPIGIVNLLWQWRSLPAMPAEAALPVSRVFALLRRRNVAFGMAGVMLTFAGAFSAFTYFRPFLEHRTHATLPQLSMLLLALGVAGFGGTYAATALLRTRLYPLLRWLPLGLALATVALLAWGDLLWAAGLVLIVWGGLSAAIPVSWSTWLAQGISDEPESGGGLMVAAIQLSIMLGGALGGLLLDRASISATLLGAAALLVAGSLVVGDGQRLRASGAAPARAPRLADED